MAALALANGEIDAAYVENPEAQNKVRNLPNVTVMDAPMPRTFQLHINVQHAPLNDVKVWQALAWAINEQGIVGKPASVRSCFALFRS